MKHLATLVKALCQRLGVLSQDYLDRTCGAHPTLVALKGYEELPECEGGYYVEEFSADLLYWDHEKKWVLECFVRYAHNDDRGGEWTNKHYLYVENDRLRSDREDLDADATDLDACEQALAQLLWTDGS